MVFVKGLVWGLAALPHRVVQRMGRALGRLLHLLGWKKVRLAREALKASFPAWSDQQVRSVTRKVFINQGLFIMEFLRRAGKPKHDPLDDMVISDEDLERFHGVLRKYKSAVFLTGHINNYEYLSAWAARLYPVTIITKPIRPPEFGAFIMKIRADAGLKEFPHHGSYRSVLRNLKAGGCVGFILDQNIPRARGVFVTFFGRPACTSFGLAMLSAHGQAPVVAGYSVREGNRLRIKFKDPIMPPPDREPHTLQDYTQRYTTLMEEIIREQPEGWIWMHRRWKTQPQPGDRVTRADGSEYVAT